MERSSELIIMVLSPKFHNLENNFRIKNGRRVFRLRVRGERVWIRHWAWKALTANVSYSSKS